jgi:hypothetical protein
MPAFRRRGTAVHETVFANLRLLPLRKQPRGESRRGRVQSRGEMQSMYGLAILGGGPAGTGPLVWAARNGKLRGLMEAGIAVVERTGAIGGTLGSYVVNADSLSTSFIECLESPSAQELLASACKTGAARWLRDHRFEYPTLRLVSEFQSNIGTALESLIRAHRACAFLPNTTAESLHLNGDGTVTIRCAGGRSLGARSALMALGGRQERAVARQAELLPGVRLSDVPEDKLLLSGRLLTPPGLAEAGEILARATSARTIIIGAAHSAFSAAWALLHALPNAPFGAGDVTILYRRPARVTYENAEAARADGYPFTADDICAATGRVHRLGGIRNDGRAVWRRLTGRPGAVPEPRATMLQVTDPGLSPDRLRRMLDEAALVVPALGYRFNTVPVFDVSGRRVPLMAERDQCAVDPGSRVLLADGSALPNVFGMGLGSGFRPHGDMAGEASFDGQQNSLWLFQNGLGRLVYEGVQQQLQEMPARPRAADTREFVTVPDGGFATALASSPTGDEVQPLQLAPSDLAS